MIDATVVKVDAANDLALLKAVGAFKPLPIAASRTVKLGGTVATVGFPDSRSSACQFSHLMGEGFYFTPSKRNSAAFR